MAIIASLLNVPIQAPKGIELLKCNIWKTAEGFYHLWE